MVQIEWHGLTKLEDFWEGEILDFEVDGEEIVLVHLDGGEIKAYQGLCPHQEVLLADGTWDADSNTLVCKGHSWELDMKGGRVINPAGCTLYEYPVKIVDDEVKVGILQDGRRHYRRWSVE